MSMNAAERCSAKTMRAHLLAVDELRDIAGLLEEGIGVPAENGDVALARFGEGNLAYLHPLGVQVLEREVVHAAETEGRDLQFARVLLRFLLEIGPGRERTILGNEEEGRRLNQHRDRYDVVHRPAGVGPGEQGVAVGDVHGHGMAIGGRSQELGHAGRTGPTRYVDDRHGLTDDRLREFADLAGQLVGSAARPPRDDELDRSGRVGFLRGTRGSDEDQGGECAARAQDIAPGVAHSTVSQLAAH
jgi:hypothetical protein